VGGVREVRPDLEPEEQGKQNHTMKTKLWTLKINACGCSQEDAADQARRLLAAMLLGGHTRGYTRGDMKGNAVGNWEQIPEADDDEAC